jgi:ribonuclease VapC
MIVDSSAVLAILLNESDGERFALAIERADICRMSAVTFVEAAIRAESIGGSRMAADYDAMLREAEVEIEPVTMVQARLARDAYRAFGKGRGHPARLNLGDCFAYALAKAYDEPLLFKGNDFERTDIVPA